MAYINRFFNDENEVNSTKKVVSPDQLLPLFAIIGEKVNKLCLVKKDADAPQKAAYILSTLTQATTLLLHTEPKMKASPVSENKHVEIHSF